MPAASDIHAMPEYSATRARYLTWVMAGSAGLNATLLLEGGVPTARQGLRLVVALAMLALAGAWRRLGWPTMAVARAILLTLWALTALEGAAWAHGGFPVFLIFLPTYSVLGTLLVSPNFGNGLAALSLVAMGGTLRWRGGAWDDYTLRNLSNLVIVQVAVQALALTVVHRLNRAARSLEASQRNLALLKDQLGGLSKTLFDDVARGLDRMGLALALGDQGGLTPAIDGIQERMADCRRGLPPEPDTRGSDQALASMEQIRHTMVGWFIGLGFCMTVALQARDLAMGNPHWGYTPALLAINLVGLAIHAWRPAWDRALVWAAAMPSYAIFAMLYWLWAVHHAGIPPNLAFAGYFMMGAPLAGGAALAATVAAVAAGLIVGRAALDPAALAVVPLAYLGTAALCSLGLWRLPQDLTRALRSQMASQMDAIRRRQRLATTLFHDLANPLQVIVTLRSAPSLDKAEAAEDDACIARMVVRMRQVIEAAWRLAEDQPVAMAPVDASKLAGELEELFKGRLARKGVTLSTRIPVGLTLLGDEALLRDSILGNLLSNAIKFSPPGGRIELVASVSGGTMGFEVRDQGPGVPAGVLLTLCQGLASTSSPGSQGETGYGYGLSLAREYLRRMGGVLELERGPAGGTIARASALAML
jgi:signal transduction histidine kinase